MTNGDKVIIKAIVNQVHPDATAWLVFPDGQTLHTEQRACEPTAMANGDSVLLRGIVNQVHEDGTAFVTLPTGRTLNTSVRHLEAEETNIEVEPDAAPLPDELGRKTSAELKEIAAAEGVLWQPSWNKAILIDAIRAARKAGE